MSAQMYKILNPQLPHKAVVRRKQWVEHLQPVEITPKFMLQPVFSRDECDEDVLFFIVRTPQKVFQTRFVPHCWLDLRPYVDMSLLLLAARYQPNGKPAAVLVEFALLTNALEFVN